MVEGAADDHGPGLTGERVRCPDRVAEVPGGTAASSVARYYHIILPLLCSMMFWGPLLQPGTHQKVEETHLQLEPLERILLVQARSQ